MLKQIKLKNFRRYESLVLDLDSGLNVITGQSDSGKTSLLQAFFWVIRNRPLGEGVRSWHASNKDPVSACIVLEDGTEIERRRDRSFNGYIVNGKDRYVANRAGVPEEVEKLLNIGDVNIQMQDDPHYLLADSPGQVASHWNKIANLEAINTSTFYAQKQIRTLNNDEARFYENLKTLREKKRALSWVNEAETKLHDLETLEEQRSSIAQELQQIKTIQGRLAKIEEEKAALPSVDFEQIETLNRMVEEKEDIFSRKSQLEEAVSSIDFVNQKITRSKEKLERLQEQWEKIKPETCPLCGKEWNDEKK